MLRALLNTGEGVTKMERVTVASVEFVMQKVAVSSTILHMANAKKLVYNRVVGDKKARKEASYFRIVFAGMLDLLLMNIRYMKVLLIC
jgi:hypothetical protein